VPAEWAVFEAAVREAAEAHFGFAFSPASVEVRGKAKAFDLVNVEHHAVGDAKFYKMTVGGNNPSAKFSTLNEYCWLLQKLPETWTKFLIVGEERALVETYVRRYGPWLDGVDMFFFERGNVGLQRIS
jgi:hypothetical protein